MPIFETVSRVARQNEREAIAEVVKVLAEIMKAGTYREAGFSSVFAYCTEQLGYSGTSAYRRIAAAKLLNVRPEIYDQLKRGELTLCTVAAVASVPVQEKRDEVLSWAAGRTKREVEERVAPYRPVVSVKPRVKPVPVQVAELPLFSKPAEVETRYQVTMVMSKEGYSLLEEARRLSPGASNIEAVVERALKAYVERQRPKVISKVRPLTSTNSRVVAKSVRDQVALRDGMRCSYCAPDRTRCSAVHHLEVDHIQPVALGGTNKPENLRLLCRAHNQLMAERVFGAQFMARTREWVLG